MPVEIKSRHCKPHRPHAGEEAQLLAYCVLVEDTLGKPVPYGILQYANQQWRVACNAGQRQKLLDIVTEMGASNAALIAITLTWPDVGAADSESAEVCGQALGSELFQLAAGIR